MYVFLVPTHDVWKLSERFSVNVVPTAVTLDPDPFNVH